MRTTPFFVGSLFALILPSVRAELIAPLQFKTENCILAIAMVIIGITMLFEKLKDMLFEKTPENLIPIVNSMFGELTVLGFLGLLLFLVNKGTFLSNLSKQIFGSDEGTHISELFEQVHMGLFLVMVLFLLAVVGLVWYAKVTQRWDNETEEDLLEEGASLITDYAAALAASRSSSCFNLRARRQLSEARARLDYLALRSEFILQSRTYRNARRALASDFAFDDYLALVVGKSFGELVEVPPSAWLVVGLLFTAVWGVNHLGDLALALALLVCGYGLALVCALIDAKLVAIQRALTPQGMHRQAEAISRTLSPSAGGSGGATDGSSGGGAAAGGDKGGGNKGLRSPLVANEVGTYGSASGSGDAGGDGAVVVRVEDGSGVRDLPPYLCGMEHHYAAAAAAAAATAAGTSPPRSPLLGHGGKAKSAAEAVAHNPDKEREHEEEERYEELFWHFSACRPFCRRGVSGEEVLVFIERLLLLLTAVYLAVMVVVLGTWVVTERAGFAIGLVAALLLPVLFIGGCAGRIVRNTAVVCNVSCERDDNLQARVVRLQKTCKTLRVLKLVQEMEAQVQNMARMASLQKHRQQKMEAQQEQLAIAAAAAAAGCPTPQTPQTPLTPFATSSAAGTESGETKFSGPLLTPSSTTSSKPSRRDRRRSIQFKQAFAVMDADGSGTLETDELKQLLRNFCSGASEAQIDDMVAMLDEDGSGTVDEAEFLAWMEAATAEAATTPVDPTTMVANMFAVLDADGSGSVSAQEFQEVLQRLGQDLSDEDVREIIREVDQDGDGNIDLEEFTAMLKDHLRDVF